MTESEAKQKWCPVGSNSGSTPDVERYVISRHCIGSACMMWRTNAQSDDTPIKALDITIRTQNCLLSEGIQTVGALSKLDDRAILYIPNMGKKGLAEIRETLGNIDNVEGRRINIHGYCGLAGKL
jgi:hypothetical protein